MQTDLWLAVLAALSALLAAGLGLAVTRAIPARRGPVPATLFTPDPDETLFLFDGEALVDATPRARAILAASPVRGAAWLRLMAFLAPQFPDLGQRLADLPHQGRLALNPTGHSGGPRIEAALVGGMTRLVLTQPEEVGAEAGFTALLQEAMAGELDQLQRVAAQAPLLIWREAVEGAVIWANAAYMATWEQVRPDEPALTWPLPRLFADQTGRLSVPRSDAPPLWFDITRQDGGLCFAVPVDATVRAEEALQSFLQTLTKTFAQLPIGLAVFDQDRRLQLFNPALGDLTGLAIDFLSRRPSLLAVLDALRDRKMLPEPKDYRSWRRQVVDMERAALSGQYEDTWNLPDGQTYRVVGRPHPNGALALMIEDISTEVLRSRRYRADLELGHAVIDEIDTALAVFAPSGLLVMSNAAYAALWGHDPDAELASATVRALADHWRAGSAPDPIWSEVEDYVATIGDRDGWQAETRLLDGRLLTCRFSPLAGGATLVAFRPAPVAEAGPPRLAGKTGLRRA